MTPLASGLYSYQRDGQPQPIREPWQLEEDGGLILAGQRDVENLGSLKVRARYAGPRCVAADIEWSQADIRTSARYWLEGKTWHWSRAEQTPEAIAQSEGALLFPLLRAATGPLMSHLDTQPRRVLVPALHNPGDPDSAFKPVLSMRRIELLGPSYWRYLGGEYGETGCVCELTPEGLLKAYHWDSAHGSWDVMLERCDNASNWPGFGRD